MIEDEEFRCGLSDISEEEELDAASVTCARSRSLMRPQRHERGGEVRHGLSDMSEEEELDAASATCARRRSSAAASPPCQRRRSSTRPQRYARGGGARRGLSDMIEEEEFRRVLSDMREEEELDTASAT